jgi:hypothetical protein
VTRRWRGVSARHGSRVRRVAYSLVGHARAQLSSSDKGCLCEVAGRSSAVKVTKVMKVKKVMKVMKVMKVISPAAG